MRSATLSPRVSLLLSYVVRRRKTKALDELLVEFAAHAPDYAAIRTVARLAAEHLRYTRLVQR